MGSLSTKKKSETLEGAPEGGEDGSGPWSASNGDGSNNTSIVADSIDAKDTLFLKELRAKGKVRCAFYLVLLAELATAVLYPFTCEVLSLPVFSVEICDCSRRARARRRQFGTIPDRIG